MFQTVIVPTPGTVPAPRELCVVAYYHNLGHPVISTRSGLAPIQTFGNSLPSGYRLAPYEINTCVSVMCAVW